MALQRMKGKLRAGRLEAARLPQPGLEQQSVGLDEPDQQVTRTRGQPTPGRASKHPTRGKRNAAPVHEERSRGRAAPNPPPLGVKKTGGDPTVS